MNIHQFYDNGLAQASYAIVSEGQLALIDPARDPQPYITFAAQQQAQISAIIETHPHADFVSSHLELHQLTGAPIYTSHLVGAEYPHKTFDDGDRIALGAVSLEAINTPGHSPDSICILLLDERNRPHAVFTGDTLFVGDVGRPDLRENVGHLTAKAAALAKQLYHSTREKLMVLPPDVLVYPAHGPGSLCGKNISSDLQSTIGREISGNYALQPMSEDDFVSLVLEQQPFVPHYFEFDVALNKKGAAAFTKSIEAIPVLSHAEGVAAGTLVIDGRPQDQFKAGHLRDAINIPDGLRFETWLGTVVKPGEPFYLSAADRRQLDTLIRKAAKIGYEQQVKALVAIAGGPSVSVPFDFADFGEHPEDYTVVDIRNASETGGTLIFDHAIPIPLPELRAKAHQLPTEKPIVVHCAGGYRSTIGASIVAAALTDATVQDMGTHISDFVPAS
ncbi:MBL fold metallo-hydrolase [Parapedobacter sp. DT-150]|uniref:MBL fold metallo-hydrolase n=1 Tax=Parapedobacter sp. DT-150 TaxID=3396162 RepID=UPI003F1C1C15